MIYRGAVWAGLWGVMLGTVCQAAPLPSCISAPTPPSSGVQAGKCLNQILALYRQSVSLTGRLSKRLSSSRKENGPDVTQAFFTYYNKIVHYAADPRQWKQTETGYASQKPLKNVAEARVVLERASRQKGFVVQGDSGFQRLLYSNKQPVTEVVERTPHRIVSLPPIGDVVPFLQRGGKSCRLYSALFAALQVPALRQFLVKHFLVEKNGIMTFRFGNQTFTIPLENAKKGMNDPHRVHISAHPYVNGFGRALEKYSLHVQPDLPIEDNFLIVNMMTDPFHDLLIGKPVIPLENIGAVQFSEGMGMITYKGRTIDLRNKIISVEFSDHHATSIYYDAKQKKFLHFDNEKPAKSALQSVQSLKRSLAGKGGMVIG